MIFDQPDHLTEEGFEARLWDRLQSLTDQDTRLGHAYDARVAADPSDSHFSLSFAGEAFFAVGLHPGASRPARRFDAPTLVFNLHDQFERLRAEGRYDRLRETIQARDISWTGSINPMLASYGERSEAPQYSGRKVPDDWACPFSRRPVNLPREADRIAADLRAGAFPGSAAGRRGTGSVNARPEPNGALVALVETLRDAGYRLHHRDARDARARQRPRPKCAGTHPVRHLRLEPPLRRESVAPHTLHVDARGRRADAGHRRLALGDPGFEPR